MAINTSKRFKYQVLFLLLVSSQLLIHDLVEAIQDGLPPASSMEPQGGSQLSEDKNAKEQTDLQYISKHRVKRKSKGGSRGGGRGWGFGGKSKSKSKPSQPYPKQPPPASYPKQPASNPAYPGGASAPAYPKQPAHNPAYPGAPPAYPGTNSRPGYPQGPPPPYSAPGAHPSYPGAPPAYPGGGGHASYPGAPPAYPGGGGYPGYGGAGGFGGNKYGSNLMGGGFGKKGGGLGTALGGAGFGAIAGTALGAYGGYKLGRMVGGLGRHGHYGYYDDHGRYMRCDPPKTENLKFDPEKNITYIPLDDAYDRRCLYFDKQPPAYYRPPGYISGAGLSPFSSNPLNCFVSSLVTFSFQESFHLFWQNAFVFAIVAILIY